MPDVSLPNVFSYLDHRVFLADWFAAKQRANPRYSHRVFASKAGFRSPSMLHLVIKGERNITERALPRFLRALDLDRDARSYFTLLVKLDRSTSLDERNALFERIRARRHFGRAEELEDAGFDYLSDWSLPAIRELAGCAAFRLDPKWIGKTLRPRISMARARRAIEKLMTLGMIEPTEDGGAAQKDASIVSPHEVYGLAVFNYHRGMLDLARKALEWAKADERHYGAVTVRVSADTLAKLKVEVSDFQERLLALCDADEDGDRVVQVNIQMFPLSDTVTP